MNERPGKCRLIIVMRKGRLTAAPVSQLTLQSLIALGPLSPNEATSARELAALIDAVELGLLMESGIYELTEADILGLAA